MSKKPSENLRNRLNSLFSGIGEATPRTGPLPKTPRPVSGTRPISGWVWESDIDGNYVWCSPEVERILGLAPEVLLGKPVYTVGLSPDSSHRLHTAMVEEGAVRNLKLEGRGENDRPLTLLVNALVRSNPAGERLGFRGVAQVLLDEPPPTPRLSVTLPASPDQIGATGAPVQAASWGEILSYHDEGQGPQPSGAGEPSPISAVQQGASLVVPIRLQDAELGEFEFGPKEDGSPWNSDERAMVEAVAQQLAVSMQDARSRQLTEQALVEMREADRLKTQFLANMSHELRTPLNSIIGFSRVILKGIDGPITELQEQDLKAIYNAGMHLLGLINDILDLSKIEAGKMELAFGEVELGDMLRSVMSTAIGLIKDKPIELVTDLPDDLPPIQGDSIRIRQVLLNLLSNAAKFTDRGQIGVSARLINQDEKPQILVAVFDTGPGIEPEDQEKLFEPFSQVDASPTRKTGGTGLGLSICRHLVELHGGRIWVESTPGEGSTFVFTLPLQPPSGVSSAGEATAV
jgi:signal transduction histidine kinase